MAGSLHQASQKRRQENQLRRSLRSKTEKLLKILKIIAEDPFKTPPSFEKLVGDLAGAYSRRRNIQHRLVYQVIEDQKVVKVIRLWTHYD